jgi:hypothetical protein
MTSPIGLSKAERNIRQHLVFPLSHWETCADHKKVFPGKWSPCEKPTSLEAAKQRISTDVNVNNASLSGA